MVEGAEAIRVLSALDMYVLGSTLHLLAESTFSLEEMKAKLEITAKHLVETCSARLTAANCTEEEIEAVMDLAVKLIAAYPVSSSPCPECGQVHA